MGLSLWNTAQSATVQDSPWGVLFLALVSCTVTIPLCQYWALYGISVGYGLSVAAVAIFVRSCFPDVCGETMAFVNLVSENVVCYGLRLAMHLFVRDLFGWKPSTDARPMSRIFRIPFAMSLSLLYGSMTAPVLYIFRRSSSAQQDSNSASMLAWTGLVISVIGNIMESVADTQKFVVKQGHSLVKFRGPTSGLYRLTRHPNYTGELLFWLGLWLAGVPSYYDTTKSSLWDGLVAWTCSTLGLITIVNIMRSAARRLEERHATNYGGQKTYEAWKREVRAPLIPFLSIY
jgi:steroid 5-alpha reductase family enzyme